MDQPIEDLTQAKMTLETALLTSPEPLPVTELCKLFEGEIGGPIHALSLKTSPKENHG